jgi:signal transduction histidine kinase
MLGYTEEEITHLRIDDIHPEKDLPHVIEVFKSQSRGEIKLAESSPVKRKDGSVFYADINTSIITLGGKKYLMGSFRDITDRKQAEEELKKAHSELEQRVAQRTAQLQKTIEERDRIQKFLQETEKLAAAGKLAAQIAHEINNPMAGIKNSFLLVKDAIPKNHRYFEYVGRIEKEIDRVSQIVRQMFDLYRPDTVPANRFHLYDTIKDIVELLKMAWQEKHINIEIDCSEKTTAILSEALLRQIIYNIVQNAIQASGPNTMVKIRACTDNGRLNLSISDQGPGIDDKIKDKIFEPFFTTGIGGPESGLGLGLAISKDIISAMDGTIDFTSEKNKGTVFNISIPIENEPAK